MSVSALTITRCTLEIAVLGIQCAGFNPIRARQPLLIDSGKRCPLEARVAKLGPMIKRAHVSGFESEKPLGAIRLSVFRNGRYVQHGSWRAVDIGVM
jgi:hypothetical protein